MVAAAVVGAAVVGGVASSSASKKASKTQADASDYAAQLQNDQYQQTRTDQLAAAAQARADNAPYQQAGYGALSQLVSGTQPGGALTQTYAESGGDLSPFSMEDYQADPGYQFRLSEGEQGINRAATASGSRYSGATLKALARFNSSQASQEYGNAYTRYNTDQTNAYNRYTADQGNTYNRLAGLSGTGQTAVAGAASANTSATNAISSAGQASATAQGTAAQNAAAATASGYVGTANALNGALSTGVNAYQQQQYLNSLNGSTGITQGATNQTSNYDYYGSGYSP